jgi:hypothetical protein
MPSADASGVTECSAPVSSSNVVLPWETAVTSCEVTWRRRRRAGGSRAGRRDGVGDLAQVGVLLPGALRGGLQHGERVGAVDAGGLHGVHALGELVGGDADLPGHVQHALADHALRFFWDSPAVVSSRVSADW